MTFNDNARINPNKVSRRGRNTGIAVGGGGGLLVIGLFIASQFLGIDLTGLAGGGTTGGGEPQGEALSECTTAEAANSSIDCRIAGAADSLDTYWAATLPELGQSYRTTNVVLFTDQTNTGCGGATSAVGPFYCPPDETIYVDTVFYDDLRNRFGSTGGPLAEMYVIAHEWGHHIQNSTGIMDGLDRETTGPSSDSVRLELQADCFAGAWVGAASTIKNDDGVTFLDPVTDAQIADALSAASAVGDDRIQESTQGQVTPETWTHGSSEKRQQWFTTGLNGGAGACNTFEVANP
ncbi:MAG: neutral zinc metallopeptidase [Rhodoglobus sp.]|uniref:KPN_02809 family neutral zinc metallopeptidase n=1 Tax=Salinibacterium sp. G-O1 TaxID=3046208 RepID=UPI0024B9BD4D|nr:neutral zinc metallopeptidase [Salinibacterium sp. G-O1]MDJ0333845.1 neutral zinc metallopeptidase [Salinibacterium sp. G-O1]